MSLAQTFGLAPEVINKQYSKAVSRERITRRQKNLSRLLRERRQIHSDKLRNLKKK